MEPHGLVPLHDAVEVIPAAVGDAGELVSQGLVLHLTAVVVEFDVGVDPGLDDEGFKGLADVVHRPQDQAVLFVLLVGEAGDEDHRHALGDDLLLEFFEQGKAVHARHDHVQKDEGEALAACEAQAVLCGLGHDHVVIALQDGLEPGGLYGAVVHDQDLFHNHTPYLPGAPPRRIVHSKGDYIPIFGFSQSFFSETVEHCPT